MKKIIALLTLSLAFAACSTEEQAGPDTPAGSKANFIPTQGKKYKYTISDEDGHSAEATKWVLGTRDSAGYKIYNVRTHISTVNGNMDVESRHIDAKNKTIAEMVMPDMWNDVIETLRAQPNAQVLEATPRGFPYYMAMENTIKENSQLTFQGNDGQPGQYIKYVITSGGSSVTMEVSQTVEYQPGKVVAVETITTPAGSFVCSKWQYAMDNTQEIRQNGSFLMSKDYHEDITMWTAHGVGVVKSVNTTESGVSTTVLNKIE